MTASGCKPSDQAVQTAAVVSTYLSHSSVWIGPIGEVGVVSYDLHLVNQVLNAFGRLCGNELMKREFPDHEAAHGVPYTGISNARPETKDLWKEPAALKELRCGLLLRSNRPRRASRMRLDASVAITSVRKRKVRNSPRCVGPVRVKVGVHRDRLWTCQALSPRNRNSRCHRATCGRFDFPKTAYIWA
jgi:hypothetical protein